MCFHIHRDHTKSKIAEEDIICFKTGDKWFLGFKSVYQAYKYVRYIPSKKVEFDIDYFYNTIDRGYHSYSTLKEAQSYAYSEKSIKVMMIPKGAEYYYDPENHQYCSNRIVYMGTAVSKVGKRLINRIKQLK